MTVDVRGATCFSIKDRDFLFTHLTLMQSREESDGTTIATRRSLPRVALMLHVASILL